MLLHALLKCEPNKFLVDLAGGQAEQQLEASERKDRFPSCGLGMMLTHTKVGLLQGGRKGAAEEAMSTSPGPGSVQAGVRWILCYGTEKGRSPPRTQALKLSR